MQFIDRCKVLIKAGNGGNGVIAWRREAHYPEGGPYGGDGGKGGDVIIIGDHNLNSLFHLRYKKNIFAQNGQNGQTKQKSGSNGKDEIIYVPIGTEIFDCDKKEIVVDILQHNQRFVIAHGGKGGYGNAHFKSSTNRTPYLYENGDIGEKLIIEMKLKFIADIGLIGLPNAGKSSLLASLTNAKPKIANYPFTTLNPILGTIDNNKSKKQFVIADIPGLISGASNGVGLGHDFLQHIERCHILLHVISLDKDDHKDIIKAYQTINEELTKYNKKMLKKQLLIIANKLDVPNANNQLNKLKKYLCKNIKIIAISAKNRLNLEQLKQEIFNIENNYARKINTKQVKIITLQKNEKELFKIKWEKENENRWIIHSDYLSYWLNRIPQTTKDNIYRFTQKLNNCNVDEILKEHGAKTGDTITINNMEFQID